MSTNFVYGSGNPLFKEPKKQNKKPVETKAQIDARIAETNARVTQGLKPILEPKGYTIDPKTGFYNAPEKSVTPVDPTEIAEKKVAAEKARQEVAADAAAAEKARQEAAAEAEKKRREGQSAYDILLTQFQQYGLSSLVEEVKNLIVTGADEAELTLALRQKDAYKKRFAANAKRIASGLSALSEREYIALEDQYQSLMRNYGLPASYYTKGDMGRQEGFEKLIAGDVSAAELEDRILTAQNRVINAPSTVTTALKQFYPDITNGDILAYTLNPEKGLADIKRKVTAAEIGGAALGVGLGTTVGRAEELAKYGVTAETARKGFGVIGTGLERGRQLSSIYQQPDYTQTLAEAEVFELPDQAAASQKRKKIIGMEKATFGGQTGITSGALSADRAGSY
jgi:hypothetical protein